MGVCRCLVVVAVVGATGQTGRPIQISPQALKHMLALGLAQPIDVRHAEAFRAGHIPGAMNVPIDRVESAGREIRARAGRKTIVTYCGRADAALAGEAARRLRALGFHDVSVLAGGFAAWAVTSAPPLRRRGTS